METQTTQTVKCLFCRHENGAWRSQCEECRASLPKPLSNSHAGDARPWAEDAPPSEVHHTPLWVKGMLITGAIFFLIQLPALPSSFADAFQKSRAATAYQRGEYLQAIDQYKALRDRYPTDKDLIKQLGLARYHAGQYREALETFMLLDGVTMPQSEIDEIEAVIIDIQTKLDPNA